MHKLVALFATIAALAVLSSATRATDARAARMYTVLDETGSQLRSDFNRAKGSVRLLFVVDPICPGCLRGLDDLNKALLGNTDDRRLQTFVVHVPVLTPAAKAKDVPPAAALLQNGHVRHYWNPSGAFGNALAEGVGLERDDKVVYAWDVWLIYGPEATWDGPSPPKPRLLMHQLRALQGSKEFPHLDGEVFAREVHQLLAELPPTTAAR
jgi:hypothetical protein